MVAGAAPAAAPVLRPAPSLRFEHIGLDEGLPQESVLTILQDHTGFMWFGTQAGLVRFDGYRTRVFRNDPADPASIVDNYVNCSHEDAQGRLWFGTRGGLVRFDADRQSFVRYALAGNGDAPGRNVAVNAIVGDGADGLWLGTGDGLVHLDIRSGAIRTLRRAVDYPGGNPGGDRVTALVRVADGAVWVGGSAGLDYLAPGASRLEHVDVDPAGGKRNAVWSLALDPEGTLWIGTGAGLEAWRTDGGKPQRHHLGPAHGMDDARVLALYHDAEGGLWVGTDLAGLKRRAPGGGRFVAYTSEALDRHSLSDNQVTAVRIDRTGTLWVGTLLGGVNRVDLASGGFDRFLPSPGPGLLPDPNSRKIRAIAFDPEGRLWLGTTGAGLLGIDPGGGRAWLRHDPDRAGSLPDDVVTALLPAHGRLWVGAATGLSWRPAAGGPFTPVALGNDAASNAVQALLLDRAGMVWALTRGGLFMLDAGGTVRRVWRHDPRDPTSLGENFGFSLAEDRAGAIWIGTENGLDRLDGLDRADPASGRFTHFRHDPADPGSLRHSRVHHVFVSSRGELWVGTAAGLHRLEQQAGRTAFRAVPLAARRDQVAVGAILEDRRGRIWVSTTVGIARLDAAGKEAELFTARDGLIDGSFFVGAAARGPDGRLYFGGVTGMTSFLPDAIRANPFAPGVVITELSVSNPGRPGAPAARAIGSGAMGTGAIVLDYREPAFTLEFAALHYADPSSNRYAYRLRGYDRNWIDADAAKRYATYTNLDPGEYVFEVRAANKDGVWSAQPARLALRITPPFWMTWWFRLAAGVAVLGAAAAVYRLRVRVLVQRTERLERQVGARTAELLLQKEGAERQRREADAQREAAERARRDIALLSDIGRELTANLDGAAIMAGVSAHVRELMDADLFAFGVVRAGGGRIDYPFVAERGVRLAAAPGCPPRVQRLVERSVALFEEILIDDFAVEAGRYVGAAGGEAVPAEDDGAASWPVPRSLLLVPIVVGSRALGALLVQSARPAAYQNVQLDMLGTLASYAGVALDNADAYRRLKETQAQLAASEKLAGLGSLVAGVAHELNTPIGNSLLMATTLAEKSDGLSASLAAGALKRSELDAWIGSVRDAMALIVRSLQAAADLVNSFKQVSVDQASAQRRRFDLATACHEIAATMMNQVRRAGHRLELRVAPGIGMDSYPGPLGQVLFNFINNALLHAFDGPGGTMILEAAAAEDGRVRIVFRDDGRGIPPEHLSRVFDPFFTTRMGQGGTGLGLNIAWTIVTTLLCGTIRVESVPGEGTTFVLDLPLRAG